MHDYFPVPVSEAQALAERFFKSLVVIMCYDHEHGLTHTTTYGRTPEDKRIAAQVGEACTKLVANVDLRTTYEDFRSVDASERAAKNERLVKACAAAAHALRLIGLQPGVVRGISDEHLAHVIQQCDEATR